MATLLIDNEVFNEDVDMMSNGVIDVVCDGFSESNNNGGSEGVADRFNYDFKLGIDSHCTLSRSLFMCHN